jgi:hypothetical protein
MTPAYAGVYELLKWYYERPLRISTNAKETLSSEGVNVNGLSTIVAQRALEEFVTKLNLPRPRMRIQELVDFLHDNKDDIQKFRNFFNKVLNDIRDCQAPSKLGDLVEQLRTSIESEYNELISSKLQVKKHADDLMWESVEIALTLAVSHWLRSYEIFWKLVHAVKIARMSSTFVELYKSSGDACPVCSVQGSVQGYKGPSKARQIRRYPDITQQSLNM